jgi:serine/threonine-protein kinase
MNSRDSKDGETRPSQLAKKANLSGRLNPGTVIGGSYEVLNFLGQGAMGTVYLAKHQSLPAHYALKILTSDKVNETSIIRFQNEAQAIAKLNHPNIVKIFNFGLHEHVLPFCVMELLSGRDLSEIVRTQGPLSPDQAIPLFIEACAGLGFAHSKGILHRDVKPANLFVIDPAHASGAKLKVVDFGIVKFAEQIKPDIQKLTAVGDVCGSPSYMSPEQACGQKTDPRADVYSLGCSLFEVLTGKLPFSGRNATETMMMQVEAPVPRLASKAQDREFDENLDLLIAKMMAKEPMDRYQSMDALALDLINILEKKPLGTRPAAESLHMGILSNKAATNGGDNSSTLSKPQSFDASKVSGTVDRPADSEVNAGGDAPNQLWKTALVFTLLLATLGASLFWFSHLHSEQKSKTVAKVEPRANFPGKAKVTDDSKLNKSKVGQSYTFFSQDRSAADSDLEFRFPDTHGETPRVLIGEQPDHMLPAEGKISFPRNAQLWMAPTENLFADPAFVSGFRAGEINTVLMDPTVANDRLLEIATSIPGIKQLVIADCGHLTAKIIPCFDKLKDLTSFNGFGSSIDGADYAKSNMWQQLTMLAVGKCRNLHTLLQKISGNRKLQVLNLSGADLSYEDYNLVATLPNLKVLILSRNKIHAKDLRALSRLPNLQELWIVAVVLRDGNLVEEVSNFPALRTIVVDRGHFRREEQESLRKIAPRIRLLFF